MSVVPKSQESGVLDFLADFVYKEGSFMATSSTGTIQNSDQKQEISIRDLSQFKKDPLVRHFYQFINENNLRNLALKSIDRYLKNQQNFKSFEDL